VASGALITAGHAIVQNHRSRWGWWPEILLTDPVLKSIDAVDSLVKGDCNPDRPVLKRVRRWPSKSSLQILWLLLEDARLETKHSNEEHPESERVR
jgi:hypothetical protein